MGRPEDELERQARDIDNLLGDISPLLPYFDTKNDGLDIISNIKIKNLLKYYKEKNIIILLSSHVIEFMDNFIDYCVLLQEGEIIDDRNMQSIASLEKLFLKNLSNDAVAFS